MGPAILVIIVLLYILLAYLASKTWHVGQVVLLVFTFIATFAFMLLATATVKTRSKHQSQYASLLSDLEVQQRLTDELLHGSTDVDAPLPLPALRGELRRTLMDRGRVWRNLRLADIGQGTITLDASRWGDRDVGKVGAESTDDEPSFDEEATEDETQPAAAPAVPALGLSQDAIVFAFHELPAATLPDEVRTLLLGDSPLASQDAQGRCRVPSSYLGRYKVISDPTANPAAITISPLIQLSDSQIEQIQNPDLTWVLYEVMPVDSHDAFAGLDESQLKMLISPVNDQMDPAVYQQLIDEYVRDGQRATDTDPPERKWMKVKFKQNHTIDVDVQQAIPMPDTPFDPSGRSTAEVLRQDEPTEFQEDDEAIFDFATAQELINQGIVDPVEPIYQRRLRDYAESLQMHAAEAASIEKQLVTAGEDLQRLTESIGLLRDQIAAATDRQQKLTEDLAGFNRERAVVAEYRKVLEDQWNALRAELSQLYRANRQVVSEETARPAGSARTKAAESATVAAAR